ncbi:hypothetical protein JXJ21_20620 [candidate division KSB1 bacterium]|nr:hypothetical protein [candidate division KSB1 bacterium]
MYPFLLKLQNRARQLGNHVRKYVRSIDQFGDALVRQLEQKGVIEQVHLWKESTRPGYEMAVIVSSCDSLEQKLNFLGCYYAIQFLQMNIRALDVLFMNIAAHQDRFETYKSMQFQVGINLSRLNAAFLESLLDQFLPRDQRPDFAICGVGTRYDMDDLDLGIIDDASSKRKQLNGAICRMSSEMMKWAIPLHLHLSQYVGEPGFTASIQEYQELLQREIHDFIIISEMLGANQLLGSPALFRQFEEQVTARYYFRPNQNNIFHEGYLRGLLGEVRSLLLQQQKKDVINPKEDAIRMIRGLAYSEKTMYSIRSANNYDIFTELKKADIHHKHIYQDLEKALLFFETFRFLYQLLIIQAEEIPLQTSEEHENLKIIADYMGYGEIGCVDECERLLTHYFEYIELAKERTDQIFEFITGHLQSISVFSNLKASIGSQNSEEDTRENIALKFAELTHFFRQTKFWDDVMRTLEADDAKFLTHLIQDLLLLSAEVRLATIKRYIEISHYSFHALLLLIMVIKRNLHRLPANNLIEEFNNTFFSSIKGTPDDARRLAKVFSHYPLLFNNYLAILPESKQKAFIKFLDIQLWEEETTFYKEKLLKLARLFCCTSEYFKRFFQKVVIKYPECILYIDDTAMLKHIAEGLLGEVDRHSDTKAKKEALGDYYSIEFLRTGLDLLNGVSFTHVNTEFTDFSDTYLQNLFDICRMEIDEEWVQRIATSDLFAVYVAGGHARGHAFDDDYDIIVILNSDDERIKRYASGIVSRMNAEIIKRGVLPHFRFSEFTGNYSTTLSELKEILSTNGECNFIDKAQILGSRRVVGSTLLDSELKSEIIFPYILTMKSVFIHDMVCELKNRHAKQRKKAQVNYNIKECIGGLRDIEMFFLILKAQFELLSPISNTLVSEICKVDPAHSAKYTQLKIVFDSLKHLRDVHRLAITADDLLDPAYLAIPAKILACPGKNEAEQIKNLLGKYHEWTQKADSIIREVLGNLGIEYVPE